MCNLSQGIKDRAMAEGRAEGGAVGIAEGRVEGIEINCISNIKQLMKNMNWSIEQAMSAIGLSEKDKIHYVSIIDGERSKD